MVTFAEGLVWSGLTHSVIQAAGESWNDNSSNIYHQGPSQSNGEMLIGLSVSVIVVSSSQAYSDVSIPPALIREPCQLA